ncbi:MAG: hypothetical protein ACFFD1_09510, partial [Candidatus Thorarchaeota archaeon]
MDEFTKFITVVMITINSIPIINSCTKLIGILIDNSGTQFNQLKNDLLADIILCLFLLIIIL